MSFIQDIDILSPYKEIISSAARISILEYLLIFKNIVCELSSLSYKNRDRCYVKT